MTDTAGHLLNQIITAIKNVTGDTKCALHEPFFDENDQAYVQDCIVSGFVSSVGAYVDRFENELSDYTGARYCVAVVNGTAALHTALILAGVERDDEVLVPSLTFVATANAITYCGAVPHFVDSERHSLGVDHASLESYLHEIVDKTKSGCVNRYTGRSIKALLPMHTFGHIGNMDGIMAVAEKFGLTVIEDAAEALGSWCGHQSAGTIASIGTLSFNGNKTITTGGGGALLIKDENLAKRAKHITTTAKVPHKWAFLHDEIGYNYRMPNINAALGCAQLQKLGRYLRAKRSLFEAYERVFDDLDGVTVFREPANTRSNYWLQTILLEQGSRHLQEKILDTTNEQGIMTRPPWTPLDQLPQFRDCPKMPLPVAQDMFSRLINIPSSPALMFSPK